MVKVGLRTLTAVAGVTLVLLIACSNLTPEHADGFADAKSGSTVTVDCVTVQCNHSKTGLIMTAADRNGAQVSIFLGPSVLADPVPAGSVVRVAVTPSDGDPTFMFASSVEVLSYPEK